MAEEIQNESKSAANKRIAKNTFALYVRMVFAMLVSLYTSRVVLQALGVEDFGTYGIVGGIVTLFAFVNNTLVGSIQRFLTYEIGKNNPDGVTKVFSNGFHVQIIFSIIIVILGETIGLYYLNHYLNVPNGRLYEANWVYQFAILSTVVRIVRAPFTASVIAYERMTVFAVVGIIDVCMKLAIVYMVLISPFDRLITYAGLGAIVSIGVTLYYVYYNALHFKDCKIQRKISVSLLKKMLSFSGWNIFGSVSLLATFQGVDLIINYFHGVAVNAALTISNQVYSATYSLTSNFQTAFNPQITKTYARGVMNDLHDLVFRTSRYSFFLVIVCAIPLIFECGGLLRIWLGTVPVYTEQLCNFMIMICVVDALSGPLWMSVYATGEIKKFQIIISVILFLNFPITAAFMAAGFSPVWAILIRLIVASGAYIYRLLYLAKNLFMPLVIYFKKVIIPSLLVTILSVFVIYLLHIILNFNSIISVIIYFLVVSFFVVIIGFERNERSKLKKLILSKVKR